MIPARWPPTPTPTAPCTPTRTGAAATLTRTDPQLDHPTRATTRLTVEIRDGRHQVRSSAGLLRAQRLHGPVDRARVALVGQTALLLGGDEVGLDIEVGPGSLLELSDIAGTVAYHGRGRAARWSVAIRLGLGARLHYAGEPLVVSDGADVIRTLDLDLAAGASARLRETLVFGRTGEEGGRLDATTVVRREGEEICRERLLLDRESRARPGVLAGVRVVDSVLAVGWPSAEGEGRGPTATAPPDRPPATLSQSGPPRPVSSPSGQVTYQLLEPGSTLTRHLGTSLAASPLAGRG